MHLGIVAATFAVVCIKLQHCSGRMASLADAARCGLLAGGDCHPRRHHPGKDLHRAGPPWLLGVTRSAACTRCRPRRPASAGSVTVRLIPAPRGAGIVAARTPKKVLQMAGIEDCYTASRGSTKTLGNFVKVMPAVRPSVFRCCGSFQRASHPWHCTLLEPLSQTCGKWKYLRHEEGPYTSAHATEE